VLSVVPNSCLLFSMCCAYADCGWLFLMYLMCSLYIGQTSRNLKTRYNEHIRYIKNNNPQSA